MPGWHPKELCQESKAVMLLLLLAFSWLVTGAGAEDGTTLQRLPVHLGGTVMLLFILCNL